jgi:aquaporin related protein
MPVVETMKHEYIMKFCAEFIGTAALVFFGCIGCVSAFGETPNLLEISLNAGFSIMMSVTIFGFFSGSFINPAVTVAAAICRVLTPTMAVVYFCAQMLGAFFGYGLIIALTPAEVLTSNHDLCVSHPHVPDIQAVGIEFIITAFLVLICCAIWEPTNSHRMDSFELKVGCVIVCLILSAGKYTGANMNPARSLAPAIWNNNFQSQWIYWVGPMLGSIVASGLYKTFFWKAVSLKRIATTANALDGQS